MELFETLLRFDQEALVNWFFLILTGFVGWYGIRYRTGIVSEGRYRRGLYIDINILDLSKLPALFRPAYCYLGEYVIVNGVEFPSRLGVVVDRCKSILAQPY